MASQKPISQRTPKSCQPQKCPDCSCILQQQDNLKYCENCKKCPILMDNTLRQPNYNLKQHYQENKVASSVVKVQGHAKDILCKLGMRMTENQIDRVVGMVRNLHSRRGVNCKGYREETALIIYRLFEDQIRMTIHQFCDKTGIKKKKFNKMLICYESINRNSGNEDRVSQPLPKLEQDEIYQQDNDELKQEQISQSQSEQDTPADNQYLDIFPTFIRPDHLKLESNEILSPNNPPENNEILHFNEQDQREFLAKTIEILYDKIFTHAYLKKHRSQLTRNIIEKSMVLYQQYLANGDGNIPKKYFRAPAIIYNVIKAHGYKISKKKYLDSVEKYLEVKLTDRMISKFANLSNKGGRKNEQDDEGSSPTSLENRETPTKSHVLGV